MTDVPAPPFDALRAHRWFAVELNNLAWDLLEAPNRTQEQTEQMIHAAHGACFHWKQVGVAVNDLRAHCLLATLYARLGNAEAALRYAQKCLELGQLSQQSGEGQTPFDQATVFGCAAIAYDCAGQFDKGNDMHAKAQQIASTFTDPDDKAVFARFYTQG